WALQAWGAGADGGDRALAPVIGVERGDKGQPATLLLRRRLVGGFGGCRGTHGPAWTATNLARTFVLLHFGDDAWRPAGGCRRTGRCRGRSSSRGRSGRPLGGRLGLAKALLGFGLGLALGLFVGAMAFVFG